MKVLLLQLLGVRPPHTHLDPTFPNDAARLILLYDSLLHNTQGFLKNTRVILSKKQCFVNDWSAV